jgi:hypothetical protein
LVAGNAAAASPVPFEPVKTPLLDADMLSKASKPMPFAPGDIDESTTLLMGHMLEAYKGDRWWLAQVATLEDDGRVTVHYSHQPTANNETVERSRLRWPVVTKWGPPRISWTINGKPGHLGDVDASTPLKVGQAIEVVWGNKWWPAEIVALDDDGRVKIRFTSYRAKPDETVERSRLKQPVVTPNRGRTRTTRIIKKSSDGVGEIDASSR